MILRWTPQEDKLLRELAADGLGPEEIATQLPDRTAKGIATHAKALDPKVRFRTQQTVSLREYLFAGGRLVREDVGGKVGVYWTRATRWGPVYPTALCERYVALGFLAPADGRSNIFSWRGAVPAWAQAS